MNAAQKRLVVIVSGIVGVVASGHLVNVGYSDYWKPARDLQELGFNWIRPWTARKIVKSSWRDGFQTAYRFAITSEQEAKLRQQCKHEREPERSQEPCFVARKVQSGKPEIDVEVQAQTLVLYYTG